MSARTADDAGHVEVRPRLLIAKRLVTCDPARSTADDPLGAIDDAAVLVERGRITAVGGRAQVEARAPASARARAEHHALVTPGLVDAHTHAAWMGSRHDEYALRLAGAGYEAIAAAGGGIVSSMHAIRRASAAELESALVARLRRMAALGVTTVEVKSGYGLDLESETKQLTAIQAASTRVGVPRVVPTYLALHALPPDVTDRSAYAARVLGDLEIVGPSGLAAFVDAYIDRSAFSTDQARPVLARAKALGLGVRVHVGQFANVGGAELAGELGAASADHLEHVSRAGADALARAGTRAVLLPVASFTLSQERPPVSLLREAGVRLCVASDANPGTAPTESLPLAMAFAVRAYGLSVAEAWLGVTREAALSLSLPSTGMLACGADADVVAWDVPHEAALVQPWGMSRAVRVLSRGRDLGRCDRT